MQLFGGDACGVDRANCSKRMLTAVRRVHPARPASTYAHHHPKAPLIKAEPRVAPAIRHEPHWTFSTITSKRNKMWTGRVHLFLLYTRYLPAGKCCNMSSKISINSHTWILKKTTEDFVSDIYYFSISWIIFSHLVCNVFIYPRFFYLTLSVLLPPFIPSHLPLPSWLIFILSYLELATSWFLQIYYLVFTLQLFFTLFTHFASNLPYYLFPSCFWYSTSPKLRHWNY